MPWLRTHRSVVKPCRIEDAAWTRTSGRAAARGEACRELRQVRGTAQDASVGNPSRSGSGSEREGTGGNGARGAARTKVLISQAAFIEHLDDLIDAIRGLKRPGE
jgi:hypothetical protein